MLLSKKYPVELLMVLLNRILVNNDSTSKIDHKNDEIKKKKKKKKGFKILQFFFCF